MCGSSQHETSITSMVLRPQSGKCNEATYTSALTIAPTTLSSASLILNNPPLLTASGDRTVRCAPVSIKASASEKRDPLSGVAVRTPPPNPRLGEASLILSPGRENLRRHQLRLALP